MPDFGTLAIVIFAFLCAGTVKGVIGMGIPMISLAILATTLGLKEAIPLILVPSILTNLWQGAVGGHFRDIVGRTWTLVVGTFVGAWFGVDLLADGDARVLMGFLGMMLCVYSAISVVTPQVPPPGRHEPWMSPAAGGISGVIMGLTGTYVVPVGLYLQALGMPRDILVQAMGVTFAAATVALGVALAARDLLTTDLGLMSAIALVPAAAGMVIGQRLRRRLREDTFRRVLFVGLTVLGLYLVARAVL